VISTATKSGALIEAPSTVFADSCTKSGCPNTWSATVSPVAAGNRGTNASTASAASATRMAGRDFAPELLRDGSMRDFIVEPVLFCHGLTI